MTETELINGCINNDRLCQSQLYKLYFPFMSKVAIRYYDNTDDAVSIINLAFLKLLQNLHKYNPQFKLATFLGRILINTILSDLELKNKNKSLFIEDYEKDCDYEYSVNESESILAYDDLLKIISILPNLHRCVFNLFVIDGYSHKEIESLLNISEAYSKWLLHDARKRLIGIINEMNNSVFELKKVL